MHHGLGVVHSLQQYQTFLWPIHVNNICNFNLPNTNQLLLLLLLLLDIGLFLASTSTIIDRIPPKESLCASLAGGVHLTGGHFRWEKHILRALTNTTLPPPIPDTYSKISGARHENVVIRRKQRHTCDQILETTKIYQDSQLHTATSPWKLRKHHHQKGLGCSSELYIHFAS